MNIRAPITNAKARRKDCKGKKIHKRQIPEVEPAVYTQKNIQNVNYFREIPISNSKCDNFYVKRKSKL